MINQKVIYQWDPDEDLAVKYTAHSYYATLRPIRGTLVYLKMILPSDLRLRGFNIEVAALDGHRKPVP